MSISGITKNAKCPRCGEYKNRGLSIDAVIQKKGKILLIKRGTEPYKGAWAIPGGHVDYDETVEDAVRREVAEETGLSVTKLTLLGVYSDPKRHPNQTVAIAYQVETQGNPKAGDDATELAWFSQDELPKTLAFDHRKILSDFFNKHGFLY